MSLKRRILGAPASRGTTRTTRRSRPVLGRCRNDAGTEISCAWPTRALSCGVSRDFKPQNRSSSMRPCHTSPRKETPSPRRTNRVSCFRRTVACQGIVPTRVGEVQEGVKEFRDGVGP